MEHVLYLGCGDENKGDGIGIDILPGSNVDVVADLSAVSYPFNDNSFDVVHCNHIIEHLDDVIDAFAEIHRICRNGARVKILVVHYTHVNQYDDPTHRHGFSYHTFLMLAMPGNILRKRYPNAKYRLVRRYLHFRWPYRYLGIASMANKFPYTYEQYFCWIAPAWMIEAELEVIK